MKVQMETRRTAVDETNVFIYPHERTSVDFIQFTAHDLCSSFFIDEPDSKLNE